MKSYTFSEYVLKNKKCNNINNIHFDREDSLLAEEHKGSYLIVVNSKNETKKSNRLYLSFEMKLDYYSSRKGRKYKFNGIAKHELYSLYPDKSKFIELYISKIFVDILSSTMSLQILRGMSIFINILKKEKMDFIDIDKLDTSIQEVIYSYCQRNKYSFVDYKYLSRFFSEVEKINYNFKSYLNPERKKDNSSRSALASTTVYQLDIFARKELSCIKERVEEYEQWMDEFSEINLFSIGNLSKTFYEKILEKEVLTISFCSLLNNISLHLYDIDLYKYINKINKKIVVDDKLIKLGKKGISIDVKSEKIFSFWHKEVLPNWPFQKLPNNKYIKIFKNSYSIRCLGTKNNINLKEFDSRITPDSNSLYPIILLLLIREGINTEVLKEWKVKKEINSSYKIEGIESSVALIIDEKKERSNSIISCVIDNNSEQKSWLDFYLKWCKNIYDNSTLNSFFQYTRKKEKVIASWRNGDFFNSIKKSKESFYKKYKITDTKNKRLNFINHQSLRVSKNYLNYLQGLNHYERQLKKGHKNIDTQISYENSSEWKEGLYIKIARTQNLLEDYFKNDTKKSTKHLNTFFNGPFANCLDPKTPTFLGSTKLKKNEICSDWFKCLNFCDKATVMPKIHGEVIYAWFEFMNEEKEQFMYVKDWEKEYLTDYLCAQAALEGFLEEEIQYAKKNSYKHKDFVKIKFKKKISIKKV